MNPSHREQFRESLIACLQRELVGPDLPPGQEEEALQESPRQRYSAGILFPGRQPVSEDDDDPEASLHQEAEAKEAPPEAIEEARRSPRRSAHAEQGDDAYDETVRLANAFLPSAIGLTFLTDYPAQGLIVEAKAAVYESMKPPAEENRFSVRWRRRPLTIPPIRVSFDRTSARGSRRYELAEDLSLRVIHRRRADGSLLVTVSMINLKTSSGSQAPSAAECFFQTSFQVRAPERQRIFREYRSATRIHEDPEESSLDLLYRNRRAFAVGHGCAADWGDESDDHAGQVATSAFPVFKVSPLEPRSEGGDEVSMYFLSGGEGSVPAEKVPDALEDLARAYQAWIAARQEEVKHLPSHLQSQGRSHLAECGRCLERIRDGIALLRQDRQVRDAFMLANRAMLMQQYHSRRRRRKVADAWPELPRSYRPADDRTGRWRCFQLAFILMNLRSLLPGPDGNCYPDRNIVDLIWFPTGGGKSEAYLGLAAYAIFLRRLIKPSNAGCTVLMRYTLRLLTAQQFQRASSMICACELIRRENPHLLGESRISIGLWVGQSLSPNTREDAVRAAAALAKQDREAENPFQILTCPWCGTEMDNPRTPAYITGGQPRTVRLQCPDSRCPFSRGSQPLPILVIDEDIYDAPPSLIIGTVDKFAMLTWRDRASSLFGLGDAASTDPPDLIIQDELHLIAGPLGSVVGLYEGIIDLLCSWRGRGPKIVASTATIRRAPGQCRALYDRDVFQFPPMGLDVADSFFATENPQAPGRIYVGVFASAAPSFVTAQVRTAGALLQGCRSLPLPDGAGEDTRDPYWTLLQYFNSLRELGHAATLIEADIPEYMWAIASRSQIPKDLCRRLSFPEELTSRRSAQEIPEILEQLMASYPQQGSGGRPLDTLLATNMISVGVDVDRLGLMMVIGQPKTTSEYIQASSRVGRSISAPGLIVSLFNSTKPRDRSHFEHFRDYHNAFYRHVEPTSVTPYSIPVMERALHALLVIAVRHLCCVADPRQINPRDHRISKLMRFLEARSSRIDPEHAPLLAEKLQQYLNRWQMLKPAEWGQFGPAPEARPLMYPAGTEPRPNWANLAWPTPSSMRNVDTECEGRVLGIYST